MQELLSIKQHKQDMYRKYQAEGLPYWVSYTSPTSTGTVKYSLAPKTGYIRRILYIKAYHDDAAASRYVAYAWLANSEAVIYGSTVAASTSVILTYAQMTFPVICYPGSSLIAKVDGLTGDKFYVSALVQDIPNEDLF